LSEAVKLHALRPKGGGMAARLKAIGNDDVSVSLKGAGDILTVSGQAGMQRNCIFT
jgi:hypothetical protein